MVDDRPAHASIAVDPRVLWACQNTGVLVPTRHPTGRRVAKAIKQRVRPGTSATAGPDNPANNIRKQLNPVP